MRRRFDPSLCLVTDTALSLGRPLTEIVAAAAAGGVTMVQLREKNASARDFLETALRLKALLEPLAIPLIINDRLDIALAAGAHGLHVGQSDLPAATARRLLGADAIIGLSVESAADARAAAELDIDYIGVSPVFTTPTKRELEAGLGLGGLREISDLSAFPAMAIGGINESNTAGVIASGAAGIAVVSAICSAASPRDAAAGLCARIAAGRAEGEVLNV